MSDANFYNYWLNSHGALVRKHSKVMRAKKYIQSHVFEHPANEAMRSARGMLPPVAGITEMWWDSVQDFVEAFASPEGHAVAAELEADEKSFFDLESSQGFMTEEHLITDHTHKRPLSDSSIKCVYLVAKRENVLPQDFYKTWKEDHGPLFTSLSDNVSASKYIQSHTIAPDLNAAMSAQRGYSDPLDGITEVWIADADASLGSEAAAEAFEMLIVDERRFVDLEKSRIFLTKEHVIFDYVKAQN